MVVKKGEGKCGSDGEKDGWKKAKEKVRRKILGESIPYE